MSVRETTALDEEEGADEEGGREEGATRSASEGSIRGRFTASYATLLRIDSLLMAPMTWKRGKEGMVTCKCVRMHMIAEEKMSLSHVEVSQYQSIIDSIMCDAKYIERPSMRERRKRARGSMIVL